LACRKHIHSSDTAGLIDITGASIDVDGGYNA
jgi:hypothetical protein